MKRTILCTLPLSELCLAQIRRQVRPYHLRHVVCRSAEDVDRALDESVEILFTNSAPGKIEKSPNLTWVQLNSAGINHVMQSPIYLQHDIALTTARGAYDVASAEFALGLILSLSRNFPRACDMQRAKQWCPNSDRLKHFANRELRGRTVGIVGYGGIGQEIARMCSALGMRPSALVRRRKKPKELRYRIPELRNLPRPELENAFTFPTGLSPLLKQGDFVVITLPLTSETNGLIDEAALAHMQKSAYLINISRGQIVREKALIRALRHGKIAGAALDVFEQEPLPLDSALYRVDNLIITPHISGAFEGMFERATELFLENFKRYRGGKELFNIVDRQRGY